MKHWSEYKGHKLTPKKLSDYDNNIYTFDTETTSCVLHDHVVKEASEYEVFENTDVKAYGFVYIWMLSINEEVYYGRYLEELPIFMERVFYNHQNRKFIVWVHNLPFDFAFIRGVLDFNGKGFARETCKPIEMVNNNVTFRCSYSLTGESLEKLSETYSLPVEKKSGDLDYSKLRHPETPLTDAELGYCEYDCLVLYHLIKHFLSLKDGFGNYLYKSQYWIPKTKTSIIRQECKKAMKLHPEFEEAMKRVTNTDPFMHDLFKHAFAGGYTHANMFNAERIHKNVKSFDFNSSYPYVMTTSKIFPKDEFRKIDMKSPEEMSDEYVYILKLKMKNVMRKKDNTIISASKFLDKVYKDVVLDNGRVKEAGEFDIVITHIDYHIFKLFYDFDCEIIECYASPATYLPAPFVQFVLDIYKDKTELKNVGVVDGIDYDRIYNRKKSDLNSLYGMCVTMNIRGDVYYEDGIWHDTEKEGKFTLKDIIKKLKDEARKRFLAFSFGAFITAQARYNLLSIVAKLDKYVIYCDTDSCKLKEGFDESVIKEYNENVYKRIEEAQKELGTTGYTAYDKNGEAHTLGIFEEETKNFAKEFITIGAKKYAYIGVDDKIHITVAGVPKKKGAEVLKSLEDFKSGFVFPGTKTGKNTHIYNNEKDINLTVIDYLGNSADINFSYGIALVPCSYKLQSSIDLIDRVNYIRTFS